MPVPFIADLFCVIELTDEEKVSKVIHAMEKYVFRLRFEIVERPAPNVAVGREIRPPWKSLFAKASRGDVEELVIHISM